MELGSIPRAAIFAHKTCRKAMIGLAGFLWLGPAHADDTVPGIPSKVAAIFDCHPPDGKTVPTYSCLLKPNIEFLGITLGMPGDKAFDHLCKEVPNARWSVRVGGPTSFSPTKTGLNCEDRPRFASSNFWLLGLAGFPCAGQRGLAINVNKGAVARFDVVCFLVPGADRHGRYFAP